MARPKGIPMTDKTKKNLSLLYKGKKKSEETKKKMSDNAKSRPKSYYLKNMHSKEARVKTAKSLIGNSWNVGKVLPEAVKKKMSLTKTGKPKSLEHRLKMSEARRGEKSHFWKGGIHLTNNRERQLAMRRLDYRFWRKIVFDKAGNKCEKLDNTCSGVLQAHHIKSWVDFPESRYLPENGQCLCFKHHKETDNYAGKIKQTKLALEKENV